MAGSNGFYYEAGAGSRRGLGLSYIPTGPEAGVIFAAFYTYDETTGLPFWVSGAAAVKAGDFSVDITLELVRRRQLWCCVGQPGYGRCQLGNRDAYHEQL